MDAPTAAEIRQRSALLAEKFPDTDDGNAALTRLLAITAPIVGSLTGRAIGGSEGAEVPVGMLELAREAVALKAAQLYLATGTVEAVEEGIERSRLRSIAAGSWSESYFGPGEAAANKQLDNEPILSSLLWALCTEDKRDEWLFLWDPEHAPGASVIEAFDYSQRPGGY